MTNIRNWFQRFQLSETIILWTLALAVGLTTGAGVWLFKRLIDLTHLFEYTQLGAWLSYRVGWTLLILPVLGGLLVGLIIHSFIGIETRPRLTFVHEEINNASNYS